MCGVEGYRLTDVQVVNAYAPARIMSILQIICNTSEDSELPNGSLGSRNVCGETPPVVDAPKLVHTCNRCSA